MLNLPANLTKSSTFVAEDVLRQVNTISAFMASLATKCRERTGDALAYFGTEYVARDLEVMARAIEGPQAKINCKFLFFLVIDPLD